MCVCSREALRTIGGFDVALRSGQDWDLWLRLAQVGELVVSDAPLVRYDGHGSVRISTNMRAQYFGTRRFHFKHRHLMDMETRRHSVAYACFLMSRDPARSTRARARYLAIAARHASRRVARTYVVSSLPRLLLDAVRRART